MVLYLNVLSQRIFKSLLPVSSRKAWALPQANAIETAATSEETYGMGSRTSFIIPRILSCSNRKILFRSCAIVPFGGAQWRFIEVSTNLIIFPFQMFGPDISFWYSNQSLWCGAQTTLAITPSQRTDCPNIETHPWLDLDFERNRSEVLHGEPLINSEIP
ncbi:MAG: hypothetical protein P8098_19240 [Candidatus Thiodiazotropha sp.]